MVHKRTDQVVIAFLLLSQVYLLWEMQDFLNVEGFYIQWKYMLRGCLGSSVVLRLPSVQHVILGAGIQSHVGLPEWSLLLPLPMSLPLPLSLSLCLCLS